MNHAFRIFLFLLQIPIFAHSQTKKELAIRYNQLINEAELKICDSNFKDANALYAKAFAIKPEKSLTRNLFTAFHCAMDVNDFASAESYLKILLSRDINENFLNLAIIGFYKDQKSEIIKAIIKKYPNNLQKKDNINDEIVKMYNKDQNVRMYFAKLNESGNYMNDSVYQVDSLNSILLFEIIKAVGHIPNENEISKVNGFPLASSYADLIILHSVQSYFMGKQLNFFDTLMYKSIFSFDCSANLFATLYSQCYKSQKYFSFNYKGDTIVFPLSIVVYENFQDDNKPYFEHIAIEEEKRINLERKKLGLSTLQELRKKIFFTYQQQLSNGKYFALNDGIITYIDMNNKEVLEKLQSSNPIYEYKP